MRIVCPNCSATYDVPEAKLAGRRSVRCVRCGTGWAPELPTPVAVVAEPVAWPDPEPQPPPPMPTVPRLWEEEPEPPPPAAWEARPAPFVAFVADRAEPPPVGLGFASPEPRVTWSPPEAPRSGFAESLPAGWALRVAWVGSIAVVLGILTALLLGHDSIGTAWPPAQRLYALVGLGNS